MDGGRQRGQIILHADTGREKYVLLRHAENVHDAEKSRLLPFIKRNDGLVRQLMTAIELLACRNDFPRQQFVDDQIAVFLDGCSGRQIFFEAVLLRHRSSYRTKSAAESSQTFRGAGR